MAIITYPLNDVQYSAEDAGLFHCTRTSGIWAEDSFSISATGADNSVTIGTGVGWISNEPFWGKVFALKQAETVDLGIADPVYPRIDVVAIQFDAVANETTLVVKNGTPQTNPIMPEIVQTETVYELYLCRVLRNAGSAVVTEANITDTRLDPALCGLMADSVTKIDTEAINSQVQALILSLTEEIENVRNNTGVLLKEGLYPVGSVHMTGENKNPAEYLGGTWSLIDRQLAWKAYDSTTDADIFELSANARSHTTFVSVEGHMAIFRIDITTDVAYGDNEVIWGNFNFDHLGFTSLPYTIRPIAGSGDTANLIVQGSLNYSNGALSTTDVYPKEAGVTGKAGDTFSFTFVAPIATLAIYSTHCDKFFWRRTA